MLRSFLFIAIAAAVLRAAPERNRATWVWDAGPLLTDAAARRDFLDFAARERMARAWIQVDCDGATLRNADLWGVLIADAHASGLAIDALDGAPDYVLPSRRTDVLNVVHAIVAYNRAAPESARFDGVHFDNEPHVLTGWHDDELQQQLLQGLHETSAAIRQITSANGLSFGIDIPFWLPDAARLLDTVDNVGIMDYRNVADGHDGMIAHAEAILTAADATRTRVFVGVETTRAADAPYWLLTGIDRRNLRRVLDRDNGVARRDLSVVEQGQRLIVGIATGGNDEAAEARLTAIARQLDARVLDDEGRRMWNEARAALANEGEWRDLARAPIVDRQGRAYGGWRANRVMLPKITFAGKSNDEMSKELQAAERAFTRHRSYAGIAIHDYATYRSRIAAAPR